MIEVDTVLVEDYKWKKEYMDCKYIDGLDRWVSTTVMIRDNQLIWFDSYNKNIESKAIGEVMVQRIMDGEVNPFDIIKKRIKFKAILWSDGEYEVEKTSHPNYTDYRLRKFSNGKSIRSIEITKSAYEMIIDDIVHPSYYIERSI